MGTFQKSGEQRFIVTMRWQNILVPYGTVAFYDGDRQAKKPYSGLPDLLFQMDAACDEQGHPKRDTLLQSFGKIPTQQSCGEEDSDVQPMAGSGKRLHFMVAICMRQHASMQGYIQTKRGKAFFRSEMELLKLLCKMMEGVGSINQKTSAAV